MVDPFLAAHAVSTDVYSLAGRSPVSIRDQITRAHYLTERLFEAGKLAFGKHLAVIGGGAAGASVAILAARRGARVALLEAGKSPFRVQRACNTRWIDPVQYDWPGTHAESAQWPVAGLDPSRVPLGFEAGPASKVAAHWTSTLNMQRLAKPGNLTAHYGARLLRIPKRANGLVGRTIEVNYELASGQTVASFDIVVIARGIAAERTYVEFVTPAGNKRFDGPLFWSDDGFESRDFGMGGPLQRQLLVSGSGDGALQDYIRLVSGQKSAIAVLTHFKGVDGSGAVPGDIRRVLYEAEQEAQRCLVWNNRKQQDHDVLLHLHKIYLKAIDDWVNQPSRWKNVQKGLSLLTGGRDVKNIRLYHQCSHFTQCYPLNHLLALVLGRFILDRFGQQTIKGNTSLISVEAPHAVGTLQPTHVCSAGCWKETHQVDYENGTTCTSAAPGPPIRKLVDGIVIRHGLKQHTTAATRRHLLPLHLT